MSYISKNPDFVALWIPIGIFKCLEHRSNNELGQILILNPNPNLAPNPTPNGLIPKSQSEFRKFYQC